MADKNGGDHLQISHLVQLIIPCRLAVIITGRRSASAASVSSSALSHRHSKLITRRISIAVHQDLFLVPQSLFHKPSYGFICEPWICTVAPAVIIGLCQPCRFPLGGTVQHGFVTSKFKMVIVLLVTLRILNKELARISFAHNRIGYDIEYKGTSSHAFFMN